MNLAELCVGCTGKTAEMRTALFEADLSGTGFLSEGQMLNAFQKAGADFPKQLVITMCRKLPRDSSGCISAEALLAAVP